MPEKSPKRPAAERIKDFFEVTLGFSEQEAVKEASRCLECKNPACVKGCPVEVDIPAFIKLIKEGKPKEALKKIKEKNNLPAVCGRVCPQESQCEAMCVLNKKAIPVNIGALERYAADCEREQRTENREQKTDDGRQRTEEQGERIKKERIAVVGSGPAGLTCSADLAKMGYQVALFESLHLAGGVLMYGIPEFRLPKKTVQDEIKYIESLGVKVQADVLIGRTLTIKDLFTPLDKSVGEKSSYLMGFEQGFKAVFVATGAGLPQFLGIPGEHLDRVYSANEFLTRVNLMKAYKFPEYATPINLGNKIAVIGGGNVAFDCARIALRLNCNGAGHLPPEILLIYRRTEEQMPARKEEIQNAKEEGVQFELLTQPVKIIADEKGFVKGMECIKMELGPPDDSGRRRPIPIKDSNFILDVDTVIVAIGQNPNPLLPKNTPGLKTNPNGTIQVDDNLMTPIKGVFAGGDIITGADTVISAMGAGKKAAKAIDKYIKNQKLKCKN